jgi:hypothetical protein
VPGNVTDVPNEPLSVESEPLPPSVLNFIFTTVKGDHCANSVNALDSVTT